MICRSVRRGNAFSSGWSLTVISPAVPVTQARAIAHFRRPVAYSVIAAMLPCLLCSRSIQRNGFRILRLMRMGRPGIDPKLLGHVVAERRFGQHTFNRLDKESRRIFAEHVLGRRGL